MGEGEGRTGTVKRGGYHLFKKNLRFMGALFVKGAIRAAFGQHSMSE